MLKRAVKLILIYIFTSFAIILVSGMLTSATTNSANTFAIIVFPSLFIFTVYFIKKIIEFNRSTQQPTLTTLTIKNNKTSKADSNQPAPINKEIVIEYNDSNGEITSRKIRVKEIRYDQQKRKKVPYSLYAYCFLKKAPRTFVLNRIVSAYDAETGEIIKDIPSHLMK